MTARLTPDVHQWFGLTYANYLVWPRSLMQSMPPDWQHRFVELAEELADAYGTLLATDYRVQAVNDRGRYMRDPVPHYSRGRTVVERD